MVLWFVVQFFRSIPNYATFSFTTNLQRAFCIFWGQLALYFVKVSESNIAQTRRRRIVDRYPTMKSNIPTPDDLKVGNEKIDYTLFIYGEPRTWWEQRRNLKRSIFWTADNACNGICS